MSEIEEIKNRNDVRIHVRQHYGQIAAESKPQAPSSCCSSSSCCSPGDVVPLDQVSMIYDVPDISELPSEVTSLSLGCGDPITLASLVPGQTVLDLGSGGGIDCFLAAKRVGERGRVIGVDMTPEMLDKARANQQMLGLENVEFRLGEIEHLPVADEQVDVVISNCVINLSPDKRQVFREAYRVLKPGGRLAVSDMVTDGPLPETVKRNLAAWAGCIAGALELEEYIVAIKEAGFVGLEINPVYLDRDLVDEAVEQLDLGQGLELNDDVLYKTLLSAKITALKPLEPGR